ncbi:MAG: DMT family transporter, partial [Patescibacteria group bacterium]
MWFLFAVSSAIIFASQELLMRILSIKTGNPRIFSLVFNLWGAAFAIALFILQGGSFSALTALSLPQYLLIGAAVLAYGLYERFQFFARRGLDAGTFTIIMRLQTVIGFVGAIFFLQESLTISKIAGLALIIIASLLLVYRNPKIALSASLGYALLCALALGSTGFIDKPASAPLPPSLYSFITWTLSLVIIGFPGVSKKEIVKEFRIGGWKVVIAALLNVIGFIFYLLAVAGAEASRVNPITATSSILTVLGGIILLRER